MVVATFIMAQAILVIAVGQVGVIAHSLADLVQELLAKVIVVAHLTTVARILILAVVAVALIQQQVLALVELVAAAMVR